MPKIFCLCFYRFQRGFTQALAAGSSVIVIKLSEGCKIIPQWTNSQDDLNVQNPRLTAINLKRNLWMHKKLTRSKGVMLSKIFSRHFAVLFMISLLHLTAARTYKLY